MPPQPLNNDKNSGKLRVNAESTFSQVDDNRKMASTSSGQWSEPTRTGRGANQRVPRHPFDSRNGSDLDRTVNQRHQQRHVSGHRRSVSDTGGQNPGMMSMGGLGMGMGMGMGIPYGMGYGYGGMMGGGGFMAGPMSMIYSVNYFIAMMGQLTTMLGMGAQAIGPLYQMARESLIQLEKSVRQSEIRRWLQRKSTQSPMLRSLLVLASMLAATQAVRLVRYFIDLRMRKNNIVVSAGSSSFVSGSVEDTLVSAATSLLPDQGI